MAKMRPSQMHPVQLGRLSAFFMLDAAAVTQGLLLGLALFVSPGPKDVLVLRQSLFLRPAVELIGVSVVSDAVLIWLGIVGASAVLRQAPGLQSIALWSGALLLIVYGVAAARRALSGGAGIPDFSHPCGVGRRRDLLELVAVSFLNPLAWVDTVLIIGAVGAGLPTHAQFSFVAGATAASLAWFVVLVIGARHLRGLLTAPRSWRLLESGVAVLMFALAAHIALGI